MAHRHVKINHGQPTGGRRLEDRVSKGAGSRAQTFPGAMPNLTVTPKTLLCSEVLRFATLLLKHTLSLPHFRSPPA